MPPFYQAFIFYRHGLELGAAIRSKMGKWYCVPDLAHNGRRENAPMFEERLREWAAARGYTLGIAGTGIVDVVKRKLEGRRADRTIDPRFYAENLSWFRFLDGIAVSGTMSVVMVAVPSPIHTLPVTAGGRKIDALIPPTYVRYKATFEDVLADMKANTLGQGVGAEILKVPLKSLAVHMGLVAYGRNNITYAPGLGSGHQLCGYVVRAAERTADGTAIGARPEAVMARCSNCRACIEVCPTGAIREDRFLISAERCYTLHSESRRPIPAWAEPPKSICLIGCMACQQVCPENKGRLKTVPSGVELTAEETEAVIKAGRRLTEGPYGADEPAVDPQESAAWRSAKAKVDQLGMIEGLEVMGRNLGLFLKRG